MASVEEDLGGGMYALRWAGTRISVTSQAILTPRQSLILKSEISPEGKPTLVVQGPALPDPGEIVGRVLYGPGSRRANAREGDEQSRQAQQNQSGRSVGGEVAAGVTKAVPTPLSQPVQSLLGLVLEPVGDFASEVEALLASVEVEKGNWQKSQKNEAKEEAASIRDRPSPQDKGDVSAEGTRGDAAAASEKGSISSSPGAEPAASRPAFRPDRTPLPDTPASSSQASPASETPSSSSGQSVPPSSDSRAPAEPSPQPTRESAPDVPPREIPVKEALTQMVRAAALPLASPSADSQSLGVGNTMPEVIADKAAGILLRAAGITPDAATMEAARALVDNNVQVDRQTVQAMMAIAAGVPEADREAVLRAAARLAAKDIPLAVPLAGGLADVLNRTAGVHELMERASAALDMDTFDLPAAKPLMDAARELLEILYVDLDRGDTASALERFISTFGREALGKALALVEKATQAALENHPLLPKIDKSMTAILNLLEQSLVESGRETADATGQTASENPAKPDGAVPSSPEPQPGGTPAPQAPDPTATGQPVADPATGLRPPPTAMPVPQPPGAAIAPVETGPVLPEVLVANPPAKDADAAPSAPSPTPTENSAAPEGGQPAPPPVDGAPRPSPQSPVNAYLNAPKAFPGLEALNLPPMPKVVSLNAPFPPETPAPLPGQPPLVFTPPPTGSETPVDAIPQQPGDLATVSPPVTRPEGLPSGMPNPPSPPVDAGNVSLSAVPITREGASPPLPAPGAPPGTEVPLQHPGSPSSPHPPGTAPSQTHPAGPPPQFPEQLAKALAGRGGPELASHKAHIVDGDFSGNARPALPQLDEAQRQLRSSILMKLESIFQIPGLNRPEIEILRPLGILDRFLNASAAGETGEKARTESERLTKDLLSDDPEKREQTLRNLPKRDQATLRETAARLTRMEAEAVRSEPLLSRLADAATSLRDLGRQLLAAKAENVAGRDRDPGVMLAEVPLKLNDDSGGGRMQMFYRRGKGKQGGWTSRVILDLNTTGMGPVLGDMRFFGQDMLLNMFVEKQDTADFLADSAEQLVDGLGDKGFRVKTRFMVLPPPPPPPEIMAERPEIAEGDAAPAADAVPGTRRVGRLDVKG